MPEAEHKPVSNRPFIQPLQDRCDSGDAPFGVDGLKNDKCV